MFYRYAITLNFHLNRKEMHLTTVGCSGMSHKR